VSDLRKIVNEQLLEKARNILENDYASEKLSCDDNEKRLLITALCLKYGFKFQFVNDCVFIYSIIDEWYFCYSKESISLLHKNKLHTTKQYHFQKKFKNIVHALQYIKKHDNFCYKPSDRLTELYRQIKK
jgi:hypothetical protein